MSSKRTCGKAKVAGRAYRLAMGHSGPFPGAFMRNPAFFSNDFRNRLRAEGVGFP